MLFAGRLDDKVVEEWARAVYQVILRQTWRTRSLATVNRRLNPLLLGLTIASSSELWQLDERWLAPISALGLARLRSLFLSSLIFFSHDERFKLLSKMLLHRNVRRKWQVWRVVLIKECDLLPLMIKIDVESILDHFHGLLQEPLLLEFPPCEVDGLRLVN